MCVNLPLQHVCVLPEQVAEFRMHYLEGAKYVLLLDKGFDLVLLLFG
jgi:hypothetical protein